MRTVTTVSSDLRNDVRLRLTKRGRVVVVLLITFVLVVGVLFAGFFAGLPSASAGSHSAMTYTTVTVDEGQNMWDIAASHAPQGHDIRDYIVLVQDVNGLDSETIHPGQTLSLPVM